MEPLLKIQLVVNLCRVHRLADQIQYSTVNVQNTHVPVSNYQCRLIGWASARGPLELGNNFQHNTLRNDEDLTHFGNILQFFWSVNRKAEGRKPQEVQMCTFMFSKQKTLHFKLSSIRYTTKQSSPHKEKTKERSSPLSLSQMLIRYSVVFFVPSKHHCICIPHRNIQFGDCKSLFFTGGWTDH